MLKRLISSRTLLSAIVLFLSFGGKAQNIAGGEISYKFLYKTLGEYPQNHYELTVKLYKECTDPSNLPSAVALSAALANPQNVTPPYSGGSIFDYVSQTSFYITKQDPNSCGVNQPVICYYVGVYTTQIALLENWGDYLIYVQADQRKSGNFKNVSTDGIGKLSAGIMGYTYTCRIPGMLFTTITRQPSSPVFKKDYPLILCAGQPFHYDFSANDPDGDSLAYRFVPAYQGKIWVTPRYPDNASNPPFLALTYYGPFDGLNPLGSGVTINPVSGMISGTAPIVAGNYILVVEVTKYRDGELVTRHRKEVQFIFSNCTWPRAQLDSTYKNCKGLSIDFTNYSTGNISKYFWDFGDPTTNADTSGLAQPTYRYPVPGTYQVKLFLNKGTTLCKDSAFATVIVDSGLNASFTSLRSLAVCNEALYDFTNTSTEGINPITSYAWDFGEPTTALDVSILTDPSYLYPTDGNKVVRLIIKNDIGCADTVFQTVQAFKSLLQAPNDTTICILDTISLVTFTNGYPGTFNWTPNYNLSSTTSPNPLAYPKVDTMYYVSFTDATGCTTRDSVLVKVRDSVAISIDHNDSTICRMDTILVSATHDGNSVTWQPVGSVIPINPDGSSIKAFPFATTDLIATTHFGSCFSEDTIRIKVVPQPQVSINKDTIVCLGAPVYLQANGGAFYLWSPAATLDNPLIANPVAHPKSNTIYTVSVYDTLGCPKHTMATVKVSTFRGLFATAEKDTMVVFGEPVQLLGGGGQYYQWSPASWLSNPNSANPITRPLDDITYVLKISNDDNCVDSAIVKIRAFKDPDIYTPTAFTPNNDGRNDLFKVFPVGFILEELKIFDRWGHVLFVTSDQNKGWDGKYKGETLASGTFVWMATGKNKKTGAPVFKKGTITLIR